MRSPGTGTNIIAGGVSAPGTAPPDFMSARDSGLITMDTAGNAVVQFAQQTATADGTIFRAQSRLLYTRIA